MKYQIFKDKIIVFDKEDFDALQILECGQFFAYQKIENGFDVFSQDKYAKVIETDKGYEIITDSPHYFEDFFDLKNDYSKIKNKLSGYEILKKPIEFGHGIRILKQNLFETLISFILSANNNIKRFSKTLFKMREKFGKCMSGYFAFPTRKQLLLATEQDFVELGAGYRAKYLYNVLRQVDEKTPEEWRSLETKTLRNKLISLSGVGPKVADCVLLFGYHRQDVFPVDTWIEQMYHKFYGDKEKNREKIREFLVGEFGELSGYAQQYLFFFMREN